MGRFVLVLSACFLASGAALAGTNTSTVAPKSDPEQWVTDGDATPNQQRYGETTVVVEYGVNLEGRVENCRVRQPGNGPELGMVTCRSLVRRARFAPGKPGTGTYTQRFGS